MSFFIYIHGHAAAAAAAADDDDDKKRFLHYVTSEFSSRKACKARLCFC